jgi:hypothetical protein
VIGVDRKREKKKKKKKEALSIHTLLFSHNIMCAGFLVLCSFVRTLMLLVLSQIYYSAMISTIIAEVEHRGTYTYET